VLATCPLILVGLITLIETQKIVGNYVGILSYGHIGSVIDVNYDSRSCSVGAVQIHFVVQEVSDCYTPLLAAVGDFQIEFRPFYYP
jgi:hypothetical protein